MVQLNISGNKYENEDKDYKWESVIEEVVPDGSILQIDWLTGILVLPYGDTMNYVHMGYRSTYSNYLLLEIKNGMRKAALKTPSITTSVLMFFI